MKTKNDLYNFVYEAVFERQLKTYEEIFRQAKKSGFTVNQEEILKVVEHVSTPYKQSNG